MAVSDETKEFLEQVKKGKPRKFVMLTKGTEIISLVVYKKGSTSKFVKEAKEEGKGIPCYGVVDGRGMDINFKLAISEGFDKAPAKNLILKKFLEEEAEFKCKPIFEIVATPQSVLDEEDPLTQRFLKLQEAATTACDTHPKRAGEIQNLCGQISRLLEEEQTNQAEASISTLQTMLNSLPQQNAQGPTVSTETPATDGNATLEAQKTQLAESLKKLKPAIDKAIEVDPGRKNELFQSMTQIAGEIKQGKVEDAKSNIMSLGKLVQGLLSQKAAPGPTVDPATAKTTFEGLKERLEPRLNEARKLNPEKGNALLNLWNYAMDQGEANNFANANTALGKLEGAIDKAIAEAPAKDTDKFGIREGIVAEKREVLEKFFLERFAKAKTNSQSQVDSVEKAIADQVPEEDAEDIAVSIQLEVDDLYEQVRDALSAALERENPDKVLEKIEEWRTNVSSNLLIQHLQKSKKDLGSEVNVLNDFNLMFTSVADKVNEVTNA